MIPEWQEELERAIKSTVPLTEIVDILRKHREMGLGQHEVYAFLEAMLKHPVDEPTDDRIREVADFVAGFCSPHMQIWS